MAKMKKIALVVSSEGSSWVSCQSIVRNLIKSYTLAFPDREIGIFNLDKKMSGYEVHKEAERLLTFSPEWVSFVDHAPHPGGFMRSLQELSGKARLPQFVVHVFGDFTLYPNEWLAVADILKNARTRFICASEKQAALIRGFLDASENTVSWIPFPVDQKEFSFSPKEHKESSDFTFFYSGRLSQQKNIIALLATFGNLLRYDQNIALWLSGPVDDIGVPYLGKTNPPGLYSYGLVKFIKDTIPDEYRNKVRYLGNLNKEELRKIYRSCDVYVSFSTHNDEDFGMAPAEAACCGLPLVLTDWGGFSSFKHIGEDFCSLIPVKIDGDKLITNPMLGLKAMARMSFRTLAIEDRAKISKTSLNLFSCESVATRLKSCLSSKKEPKFRSFSKTFRQMAGMFKIQADAPFASEHQYSPLYREIYEPYF